MALEAAQNLYYLNGLDMCTTYGFVPEKDTSETFIQLWDAKEPESYDWGDEDGIEYEFFQGLRFKPRVFELEGNLIYYSKNEMFTKINALFAVLRAGPSTIKCMRWNQEYSCLYSKCTKPDLRTKSIASGKIIIKITLVFNELLQNVTQPLPNASSGIPANALMIHNEPIMINNQYITI